MRRVFCLAAAALLAFLAGAAEQAQATTVGPAQAGWGQVGELSFATGDDLSLALDRNGTPYIAFRNSADGSKASVMRFDGTSWVQVGGGAASTGAASDISLALDGTGIPYVAFSNAVDGGKLRVVKLNNSDWVKVGGDTDISSRDTLDISLAVDNSGTPFVAYSESGAEPWDYAQATMKTLNGTDWGAFRGAGFSVDAASSVSLALNSDGIPHVAYIYQDVDERKKIGAIKYGDTSWVPVGTAGFAEVADISASLAVDSNSIPYVAFSDAADGGKANVLRFNGITWTQVGAAAASEGAATNISLALSTSGVPYVAYSDAANSGKVGIKKLNGTAWEQVGTTVFQSDADNINLVLSGSGTPYVLFSDMESKISVMKYSNNIAMPWLDLLLHKK
ncbi:hypothetical protein [Candidatus Electronema sp. JM]|uniref:hypothetical protein n=1 Tax=Candidatus Electronema sp. JM TaxID=3401571 RepID=UPI003AA83147